MHHRFGGGFLFPTHISDMHTNDPDARRMHRRSGFSCTSAPHGALARTIVRMSALNIPHSLIVRIDMHFFSCRIHPIHALNSYSVHISEKVIHSTSCRNLAGTLRASAEKLIGRRSPALRLPAPIYHGAPLIRAAREKAAMIRTAPQSTDSLRHSVLSGMRFVHRGPIRPAAHAEACRPLCGHSEASASRKRHIWSSGPDPFPMEKPLERAPAT